MRKSAELEFVILGYMESAPDVVRGYFDWAVVEIPGILRDYQGQARELELERYMPTLLWGARYRPVVLLMAALEYTKVKLEGFKVESAHRFSGIE